MIIYEALYNPSCCESAPCTISIHKTKLGAYMAIKRSKIEAYTEWYNMHIRGKKESFKTAKKYGMLKIHSDEYKFDFDKWWGILETELLD
jgi:hypothetical protein